MFLNIFFQDFYLEAIARFGFLANNIEDGVDELGSLGVVTFSPVVSGSGLSENKVVRAENLSEGSGTDRVHGSGLQVDEDGTGNIFASSGLKIKNKSQNATMILSFKLAKVKI